MKRTEEKDEFLEALFASVQKRPIFIEIVEDRIDVTVKWFGIVSGIITLILAALALYQFHDSTNQKNRELRFQQATTAKELVDDILEDDESWETLLMIDYGHQGRIFEITPKQQILIKTSNITRALTLDNRILTKEDIFIRQHFDSLLFSLGRVQSAINIGMILEEDTKYPLEYYTMQMCTWNDIRPYIKEFASEEACQLIYKYWINCDPPSSTRPSSNTPFCEAL